MALASPSGVFAHCDTMDGPVVVDAKAALSTADVSGVLKWVAKDKEEEIKTAFQKTLAVRAKGADAHELADLYFFETLVRMHRAGEGAPYTGLKLAGTDPGPAVKAADQALEQGNVDELAKRIPCGSLSTPIVMFPEAPVPRNPGWLSAREGSPKVCRVRSMRMQVSYRATHTTSWPSSTSPAPGTKQDRPPSASSAGDPPATGVNAVSTFSLACKSWARPFRRAHPRHSN